VLLGTDTKHPGKYVEAERADKRRKSQLKQGNAPVKVNLPERETGQANDTADRRNYWGELAVWSERHIGTLLVDAKEQGVIKQGGDKKQADTLSVWLGTDTDTQARAISSRSQKLAALSESAISDAIATLIDAGDEVSKAAVRRTVAGAHVSNNSGENEWYTPSEYIEAARKVPVTLCYRH
jgi:hypothetical protein